MVYLNLITPRRVMTCDPKFDSREIGINRSTLCHAWIEVFCHFQCSIAHDIDIMVLYRR